MPDLLPSSQLSTAALMGTPTVDNVASGTDWGQVAMLGNDIAMQWYAATHDKQPTPLQPTVLMPTTAGVQQTTTLLILAAVVVAAIVLLRK